MASESDTGSGTECRHWVRSESTADGPQCLVSQGWLEQMAKGALAWCTLEDADRSDSRIDSGSLRQCWKQNLIENARPKLCVYATA